MPMVSSSTLALLTFILFFSLLFSRLHVGVTFLELVLLGEDWGQVRIMVRLLLRLG